MNLSADCAMIDFCQCGKTKFSRDDLCADCIAKLPNPVKVKEVETKGLF